MNLTHYRRRRIYRLRPDPMAAFRRGRAEREALKLGSVVNLDALTYAGNPANLASVEDIRSTVLCKATSPTPRSWKGSFGSTKSPLSFISRRSRTWTAPSMIRAVHQDERRGDLSPARDGVAGLWPRGTANRFLHVSTDEVFGSLSWRRALFRNEPLRAEQPLCRLEGRQRPSGARLFPDLRPAGADLQLLQ